MRQIALAAWLLLSLICARANSGDALDHLRHVSNEQLCEMGKQAAYELQRTDSALIYFETLTSRYRDDMSRDDKRLCAMAYIYLWSIHFDRDCNLALQYESLTSAQNICREADISLPEIDKYMAYMYHMLADMTGDRDTKLLAMDYYRKVFSNMRQAERQYWSWADLAMTNMAICAHELGDLSLVADEERLYRADSDRSDSLLHAYNLLLLDGYHAMNEQRYAEAAECFNRQLPLLTEEMKYIRMVGTAYQNKAMALLNDGHDEDAIGNLLEAKRCAENYDFKDMMVEIYKLLSEAYAQAGHNDLSTDYMRRHFLLKDSIYNNSQISALDDMKVHYEVRNANNRYRQLLERQSRMTLLAIGGLLMALVVALFLIVVGRKNKQLNRRNQALYAKNQEMLAIDRLLTQRRHESSLGQESMARLKDDILTVMENTDEVCSPDFNIDRLTHLVGSNQKYVSQTINDGFGCNFNTFLNKYRIREACRRLNDQEKFGRYTMDALANSLGFKSRTTFTSAFKSYTGQTPSEYMRMARQSHERTNIPQ